MAHSHRSRVLATWHFLVDSEDAAIDRAPPSLLVSHLVYIQRVRSPAATMDSPSLSIGVCLCTQIEYQFYWSATGGHLILDVVADPVLIVRADVSQQRED